MNAREFKRICDTAEGYIDLGLFDEAVDVLDSLPTQAKVSREVIAFRMRILVKSGQPFKASYLGENLCFGDPDNVGFMLEVAQLRLYANEPTEANKWLRGVEASAMTQPPSPWRLNSCKDEQHCI